MIIQTPQITPNTKYHLPKTPMCATGHVYITAYPPVALAPPMQQFNALLIDICDLPHPVIILMNHTGDDIEWVLPIAEEQCQCLEGHKSYH